MFGFMSSMFKGGGAGSSSGGDYWVEESNPGSLTTNLEGTSTVRYGNIMTIPALTGGENESTAIYGLHSTSGTEQRVLIYLEVDENQTDATGGAAIKGVHQGYGDWQFVACIPNTADDNSPVGIEVAAFTDRSRNYISTMQYDPGGTGAAGTNSVNYTALWEAEEFIGGDGKGHGIGTPNFGMFFADNVVGNALTIRKWKQDPGAALGIRDPADDGTTCMRIIDHPDDDQVQRFAVYNSGAIQVDPLDATTSSTIVSAPNFTFRNKYWATSQTNNYDIVLQPNMSAVTPTAELYLQIGGSTEYIFGQANLDMQSNSIASCGGITLSGAVNLQGNQLQNVATITKNASQITFDSADLATIASITLTAGSGTGLDMQTKNIVSCGNLTIYDGTYTVNLNNSALSGVGNFTHASGKTFGVFGAAAVSQQADIGAMSYPTHSGTPDTTLSTVSGSGDDSTINDNFHEIGVQLNALRTVFRNLGFMA